MKANKLRPKVSLEVSLKSASGKHVSRVSSVAELRVEIQHFLPVLDPYAAQAAAHLVVVERANIVGREWQIQIVGEWVLQPIEAARKQGLKPRAKAASPQKAEPVPARDPAQSQPSSPSLFTSEEPET